MRKREQQDEKLMFEIAQENKRMSEPLRKARQVQKIAQSFRITCKPPSRLSAGSACVALQETRSKNTRSAGVVKLVDNCNRGFEAQQCVPFGRIVPVQQITQQLYRIPSYKNPRSAGWVNEGEKAQNKLGQSNTMAFCSTRIEISIPCQHVFTNTRTWRGFGRSWTGIGRSRSS